MKTIKILSFLFASVCTKLSIAAFHSRLFSYQLTSLISPNNNATSKLTFDTLTLGDSISSMNEKNKERSQKHIVISFINGIYHSEEDWRRISRSLQIIFQCEVRAFYNPSSGYYVKDLSKAGIELAMRPSDLLKAKELAEHWRSILQVLHPQGRILHISHSGGAILTYLAVKHHISVSEAARIDIANFGGGKSITHKYFRGRVVNYYSRNDPLTLVDKRTNKLLKQVISNSPLVEMKDNKHNTTFVFLEAVANNPILDHSMEGPTYRLALSLEAAALRERMKSILLERHKEKNTIRHLRKKMANITGMHHFWDHYVYNGAAGFMKKGLIQWSNAVSWMKKSYPVINDRDKEPLSENVAFRYIIDQQNISLPASDKPLNTWATETKTVEKLKSEEDCMYADELQYSLSS